MVGERSNRETNNFGRPRHPQFAPARDTLPRTPTALRRRRRKGRDGRKSFSAYEWPRRAQGAVRRLPCIPRAYLTYRVVSRPARPSPPVRGARIAPTPRLIREAVGSGGGSAGGFCGGARGRCRPQPWQRQKNSRSPSDKAARTAKWATTMTKWSIAFDTGGKTRRNDPKAGRRWQLVAFNGPHGGESRGIVAFTAIRKDHREHGQDPFKRGDLFEIVLVQVKGGGRGATELGRFGALTRRREAISREGRGVGGMEEGREPRVRSPEARSARSRHRVGGD